ncbi:MAG TPA: SusC/RagA family TonB-linked outer membrane protein [Longimicrobiales bacterium]|nr:SusC/RagA family TonB-linked outer membrane protein [Longimicrobiales bacterium]
MLNRLLLLGVCFTLVSAPVSLSAQQRGTVTGTVVDVATQRPLVGAQVQVLGTQLGTVTNQQGRFVIANVPIGTREVRVTILGFTQATQSVQVTADAPATVTLAVRETAIAVEGVYVTASGETQRRREAGNTVGNINPADLELTSINNVAQLLTARTPGVTVISSSGTTGGSQRIRIRGSNSVSLSNEPLLIVDGVRLNNSAESNSFGVGGQTISRLNDLNPDEIENVSILKGPAAAAMYGTAAANGVIQITTKRGRAGSPRWSLVAETGVLWDPTEYPINYGWRGTLPNGTANNQCTLFRISTNACVRTGELLTFSPLDAATPFRNADNFLGKDRAGTQNKLGLSVAGGSETFTYFVSGDRETELGNYPNNEQERLNLRANIAARLRDNFDLTITTGWTNNYIALPQNDNNLLGQVAGALLGNAVDDTIRRGYAGDSPDRLAQLKIDQDVRRFLGGLNANFRPLQWLSLIAQGGIDGLFRSDGSTLPANTIRSSALNLLGFRGSNRAQFINYNLSLGATASHPLNADVTAQTSTGVQFQREELQRTDAFGRQLLAGTERLSGTSSQFAVDELYEDNRTIGVYVQEQLGYKDRLFLTLAARGDDNSAFGADFGLVVYPSASASWVMSEEAWFPEQNVVNSFRVRTALGTSGLRPTFRDAISFFTPVSAAVNATDVPAFTVGGIGDPSLKPEFTREIEAGFDVGLLQDRLGAEVTYYNKRSRDALIFRPLAPSVGAARGTLGNLATGRFENIGKVSNTGWEVLVRAQALNLRNVRWELQGTFSNNNNKLVELGEGVTPIIFGLGANTQRHTTGFPIGGYWDRRMTSFDDANSNGIIEPSEVVLTDTAEFIGNPNPGREYAFATTLTLFELAKVNVTIDGKGDYVLNNSTRFFRCASAFVNCREAYDASAPLEDQARAIAAATTRGVYFEDASFVKLREVSLTLMAPTSWNERLRVNGLSITFAGRNLKTWTDYTGFDPELNWAGGSNQSVSDFLTQPQLRYFTTRVNLNF